MKTQRKDRIYPYISKVRYCKAANRYRFRVLFSRTHSLHCSKKTREEAQRDLDDVIKRIEIGQHCMFCPVGACRCND